MDFVKPEIEQYCTHMSTVPSMLCDELADYTRKNVEMSIMLSGPMVASTLGFLMRSIRAKRVLEIGTFTGYSALAMAEQLPADGELITLDQNPSTLEIAKRYWQRSPAGGKIRALLGDAHAQLERLEGPFDFAFIDADKTGYPYYVKKTLALLSPNGIIAVDNSLYGGAVLNPAEKGPKAIREMTEWVRNDNSLRSCLLPIRDGLLLIQRDPRV